MPPQQTPVLSAPHHQLKGLWFVGAFLIVLIVGILMGVGLAHSNSDYVCSRSFTDAQQGACTNGGWTGWTNVNGVEQRTYTGTQVNVSYAGSAVESCSHPQAGIESSTGSITTAYAACQIVETGTANNTGNGDNGQGNNGSTTTDVTVTGQTVTTGDISTSTQNSGNYSVYQNTLDAVLATSTITATPSLVTPGATTKISWTSDHVKTCVVTSTNADTWSGLTSPAGGETSAPIAGQTIYTLSCTTAIGNAITSTVIVNLVPVFNER